MTVPSSTRPGSDGPPDVITVAGQNLVEDLMGQRSFTELIFMLMAPGRTPTDGEAKLIDALLVTFADHGVTPSSIVARLTLLGAPEAFQGAVAAGLTGAGSRYLGTMEQTAELLGRVGTAEPDLDPQALAQKIVRDARATKTQIPGVGHPEHRDGDPRVPKLVELAQEGGVYGRYTEALLHFPGAIVEEGGKWLPVNAAGMGGALICDMDFPPAFGRGLAVIARAAGLVGHLLDEQRMPTAQGIWDGLR